MGDGLPRGGGSTKDRGSMKESVSACMSVCSGQTLQA